MRVSIVILSVLIVIIVVISIGCSNDGLHQENERLKQHNERLLAEKNELEREYKVAPAQANRSDTDSMVGAAENNRFNLANKKLARENEDLKKEYKIAQDQASRSLSDSMSMASKNERLKRDNEKLARENEDLKRECKIVQDQSNKAARDGMAGAAMSAVAIYFAESLASGTAAWPSTLTSDNFAPGSTFMTDFGGYTWAYSAGNHTILTGNQKQSEDERYPGETISEKSGDGNGNTVTKYADAKDAINKQADMMEEFAVGVENAKDSAEVVVVLEKFQKTALGAKKEMLAIVKKYPDLKDKANPPEELAAETKRLEEIGPKFMGAMMKIIQDYGEDSEVKKALEKMQAALTP